MNNNYKTAALWSLVTASLVGTTAGCQGENTAALNAGFRPDDEPRSMDYFLQQQAANGAREDATFYPAHFDGDALNSLGRAKLDAMAYRLVGPLKVYVDVPADASFDAKQAAVLAYLDQKGVAREQVAVAAGINPASGTPAYAGLRGLDNLSKAAAGTGGENTSAGVIGPAPQ